MDSAEEDPQDNLAQLKSHLKTSSLAERLVSACIDAGASDPRPAVRKVLFERIEELRHSHGGTRFALISPNAPKLHSLETL
jgi:hypothetical protein